MNLYLLRIFLLTLLGLGLAVELKVRSGAGGHEISRRGQAMTRDGSGSAGVVVCVRGEGRVFLYKCLQMRKKHQAFVKIVIAFVNICKETPGICKNCNVLELPAPSPGAKPAGAPARSWELQNITIFTNAK